MLYGCFNGCVRARSLGMAAQKNMGELSVGIRSIENKKIPTARTQSKPRCNLEDGSNEGMNETNP
jgi:hypothetical protein